ncbi:TPA: hypothetical protein N0F65_005807 [Lagenidium giganteum]|uniref:tRNA-binding domain-containing protein n=1 Tax=Lagenidium giganteum TaxID=4803 RepID=A0AAV2YTD4_9STRA|nr:TPA: hypothetical protein N0F65_005807 [Lagenidium giganteum]
MGKNELIAPPLFSTLDLRVGRITEVTPHPTAERMYIEKVDIGNDQSLELVAEHQPFFSNEELLDRKVVVLCNLKSVKVNKVKSQGQILTVVNEKGQQELVDPVEDAEVGERVIADGEEVVEPVTAIQLKKLKTWENLSKEIKTNNKLEVLYKEFYPLSTKGGKCTVESMKKAPLAA